MLPFILRGVSLLGVDSVQTPIEERKATWERLAGDLRPPHLDDSIAREIDLDGLEDALTAILRGELSGRTIVKVGGYRAFRSSAATVAASLAEVAEEAAGHLAAEPVDSVAASWPLAVMSTRLVRLSARPCAGVT